MVQTFPAQSEQADAPLAWAIHQSIMRVRRIGVRVDLELGRLLCRFRDARAWEALGEASFDAYLATPEVKLSRRHAYRLMKVVGALATPVPDGTSDEGLVPDRELQDIGIVNAETLAAVVNAATEPQVLAELVDAARTLSSRDFIQAVRERTTGPIPDDLVWLDVIAQRIISRANRLTTSMAPADLLDEIETIAMSATEQIARLRRVLT